MKLEDRYLVLKRKDLEGLHEANHEQLRQIEHYADFMRNQRGKEPLHCVVIESDWPEYPKVIHMLSQRVDNEERDRLNGVKVHQCGAISRAENPIHNEQNCVVCAKGLLEQPHPIQPFAQEMNFGSAPAKHSHYKKDVSHLDMLDIYRVLDLFEVNNPAVAHAIKKLLVPGKRGGGKSLEKDYQEAIDSIQRALDMLKEDQGKNDFAARLEHYAEETHIKDYKRGHND